MTTHALTVRRYQIGKSPIGRGSPLYGCTGRCSCGWTGRSNRAPSQGGRSDLQADHLTATDARTELDR